MAVISTKMFALCIGLCLCIGGAVVDATSGEAVASSGFSPVVIVPGTAGSQLDAKLDKPSVKHFYCEKKSDWFTLWLSVTNLIPPAINCWVDNILLLWDPSTKLYSNNVGVTTRTPGWGTTEAMEYLDPKLKVGQSDYFYDLVQAMVGAGGVRNVSIRGSPYDFRRAPSSAYDGQWQSMMVALVEETYSLNNDTKVTLLSHSMGCLYSLWFLNQQPVAWKDKYIKQWIPTSGVFGGAGSGIKQLVSGDAEMVPGVSSLTVRGEQRSYESSMILAPTPQVWDDFPLVRTPTKNYTASDYEALFAGAKFEHGFERWTLLANLTSNLDHPEVNVVHMYGTGVDTPTAFSYKVDGQFDDSPTVINGDGDGTVPLASLESVSKWSSNAKYTFKSVTYTGQNHAGVVKFKDYISHVLKLLAN